MLSGFLSLIWIPGLLFISGSGVIVDVMVTSRDLPSLGPEIKWVEARHDRDCLALSGGALRCLNNLQEMKILCQFSKWGASFPQCHNRFLQAICPKPGSLDRLVLFPIQLPFSGVELGTS